MGNAVKQYDTLEIHESDDEDFQWVTPLDIKVALPGIARYQALASQFDNWRLVELFDEVAKQYETEVVRYRFKKVRQTNVTSFFM